MSATLRAFSFGASLLISVVFGGATHAADLYGWLFSQQGQAMPGQPMQLTCPGHTSNAQTDSQGFYQFNGVPTGFCQLQHKGTNQVRQIYVDPGRSRHDLNLRP